MAASRNKPFSNLSEHVAAFVAARVEPTQGLCVGLSGGRDSVSLLHAAVHSALKPRLSAVHVHHGLSPFADDWAEHCRLLCHAFDVPFQLERVEVSAGSGFGTEAAARAARYEAFGRVRANFLLLAHHRDDQAETVLFNLLRGSGVAGAAGMQEIRSAGEKQILRPLLSIPVDEISAYATRHELVWVEDESNLNTDFSRNFLRHEIFPRLSKRFPAASEQLVRAAAHFSEADELLAELAELDWQRCADGETLPLKSLRTLSAARLRNLLRWRLRLLGWRSPVAVRLDEYVRQLLEAGPEGRPQLQLPDGEMRIRRGALEWVC